ncbi:Zn2/Cys6 DNA-binding protein [Ilyonectria robusta]
MFAEACPLANRHRSWILIAGLVLGFAAFVDETANDDTESFRAACDILKKLGQAPPQARHFSSILVSFSEVITQYRQRKANEKRRAAQQYVDQIFIIDHPQDRISSQGQPRDTEGEGNEPTVAEFAMDLENSIMLLDNAPTNLQLERALDAALPWENLDNLDSWNFDIDCQSFDRFFDIT